jgi:light-regulated signal transduction histidine kinase (bacteriophytochrome)
MVSSYLQLLERRYADKLDDNAREFIAYAVDGANRMKTLIQDLLAISRVGTRGKPFAPPDCGAVLKRVLTTLQPAIKNNHARISHDPLPTVLADSGQLEQLLQNLLSNALKFHAEAPPEIYIGVKQLNGHWQFSVRDNGIGFDPEFAEKIFIIFQRLHGKEEYSGTGIGLAICKKIVERHGGRIWVESQPSQGSTFYFTLPHAKS